MHISLDKIPERLSRLLLHEQKKILVISHLNPDGDAIGSVLAFYHFLSKRGHQVTPMLPNEYPEFLKWMPGNDKIFVFSKNRPLGAKVIQQADIICCLDFNHLSRTGDDVEKLLNETNVIKLMIDHHPGPDDFAEFMVSDTSVSSTAELVFNFIAALNAAQEMDKDIASCIYTGIMTDTGCFSFNSSNASTFQVVGELLRLQIEKDKIYSLVYDNYSESRMRLMGYSLNKKMVLLQNYHTAYIALTVSELEEFNFAIGDTEGFVNLPFSISGIKFTALFVEKSDHIKLSFRSKGSSFSVNEFSRAHFEGGGHTNAAGGRSSLPLNEAIEKFENLLDQYEEKLAEKDY